MSCGTGCGTGCDSCCTSSGGRRGLFRRGSRGSSSCNNCCYGGSYGGSGMMGMGGYALEPSLAPGYASFYQGPVGVPQDQAILEIHVPADAILTVDGAQTQSTGPTRVLIPPPLQQGKEYSYELKAKVNRNGKDESKTQTVKVRPGQPTQVTMNFAGMTGGNSDDGARRLPSAQE